jgi:hypothetical protein
MMAQSMQEAPLTCVTDIDFQATEERLAWLKDGLTHLRTPHNEESWSRSSVFWSLLALAGLFIAIWAAMDKLLLFEMEEQVGRTSRLGSR